MTGRWSNDTGSSTQRGHGAAHRSERERLLPLAIGSRRPAERRRVVRQELARQKPAATEG